MNIAIFASGSGSNTENIARYFERKSKDAVTLILTNNPQAGVISRARQLQIPVFVFTKEQLETGAVLEILNRQSIDFVVLAGFLKLVPSSILEAFPRKVVNIHPALLPNYGGKGMYGLKIHEAVKSSGDDKTGITIHYVNEKYDDGDVILQVNEKVRPRDTVADIEKTVHRLEYNYYPEVIEDLLEDIRAKGQS